VYHYNPDVDIAVTCWLCPDAPCVKACIVSPGLLTRRKALYRDPVTSAIKNDPERCQECGQCAIACKTNRSGVIKPNPDTNRPERMCTLCNGDPQCVKYCTYGALSFQEVDMQKEYFGLPPQKIAEELYKKLYLN
jgi:anaerobic carbon-monoxide dehydrogenase iron sulfur subunit